MTTNYINFNSINFNKINPGEFVEFAAETFLKWTLTSIFHRKIPQDTALFGNYV